VRAKTKDSPPGLDEQIVATLSSSRRSLVTSGEREGQAGFQLFKGPKRAFTTES